MDIFEKKFLILCGTGGVGKTTISAALALKAAMAGKKVGLITIDPAKRLATSLGLNELQAEPQKINSFIEKKLATPLKGSLSALMLNSQDTLHKFLFKMGGQEVLDTFLSSELFTIISDNFSGTHDYLAMEKLYELHNSNAYDLIILDTPPARHTLDFLSAPDKIANFFDDRIFQWFLVDPRNSGLREKIRVKGTRLALSVLEKITGEGVINDFIRIAPHIYKVKNAFVERQREIQKLIRSNDSGAIFVSSPTELSRGEAKPFIEDAGKQKITILSFIVNRSLQHLCPISRESVQKQAKAGKELMENYNNLLALVDDEKANITFLEEVAKSGSPVILIPELENDIHDIIGLHGLAQKI